MKLALSAAADNRGGWVERAAVKGVSQTSVALTDCTSGSQVANWGPGPIRVCNVLGLFQSFIHACMHSTDIYRAITCMGMRVDKVFVFLELILYQEEREAGEAGSPPKALTAV